MNFSASAAISVSGMNVERARLDAAALNLANIHTSRSADGGPYKPVGVISTFGRVAPFGKALSDTAASIPGAEVLVVQQLNLPPRMAYEPGHPDADSKGFVAYPAVDAVSEMVNVMTAVRAYEANVIALNGAKAMTMKAMEIGGNV